MKPFQNSIFASLVLGVFASPMALAQSYPSKPIQLIAQQPPGSGSDAMTRVWADCAARELGQPVVVQNKPGANGVLAINYLKSQAADGYTLMQHRRCARPSTAGWRRIRCP